MSKEKGRGKAMSRAQFERFAAYLAEHREAAGFFRLFNHLLPALFYVAYPVLLIVLVCRLDLRFWKFAVVPAVVLGAVTLLRKALHVPRPYERWGVEPLIPREAAYQSFPSRHVASAAIIALTFGQLFLAVGWVMGTLTLAIAVLRVLAGIHSPLDVLAGAALALLIGLPAYLLLP